MKGFSVLQVEQLLLQGIIHRLLFKDYNSKATELDCPGSHGPIGGERERDKQRQRQRERHSETGYLGSWVDRRDVVCILLWGVTFFWWE